MTAPANGYVPAAFLEDVGLGILLEKNAAAAFTRLYQAHPTLHTNGPASGYWPRALDIAVHANPGKYGISASEAKRLSPIGKSPHGLGIRVNMSGITPTQAAQFGFIAFNAFTYTFGGPYSWDQITIPAAPGLGLDTLAHQVINGQWGNGPDRKSRLASAGYDPTAVQAHVNTILGINPAPASPTAPSTQPASTTPAQPTPTTQSTPDPKPVPPTPTPQTTPKAPTVTQPTKAQIAADVAQLQADSETLSATVTDAPLAGLLAAHTKGRKRAYIVYASLCLILSFGSDLVTYGIVTGNHITTLTAWVGFSTSALLKVGTAFGFVAASNAKG